MTIELVCLDMAGTTVRDDGAVVGSFREAMVAVGVDPESERFNEYFRYVRETMGQSKIEVFSALFGGDLEMAQQANRAFEAAYGERITADGVELVEGTDELLDFLTTAGIKITLTTGFSAVTRDAIISALELKDRVDLVVSPGDAGRGRPFPDMIWYAATHLEIVDIRSVAVVGDTASDLLSGHRAGAAIVAGVLTGAHDRETLSSVPHTHILESAAELIDVLSDQVLNVDRSVQD